MPPGVQTTTVIGNDPAMYPLVSHESDSVFVGPGAKVSLIGGVTFVVPQLIQTEKFPRRVPVLFSLTVKVTMSPTTGVVGEDVTETMVTLALPVLIVTWAI